MDKTDNQTLIEKFAEEPTFLDHKDDYEKCGVCLKQMLQYQVCREMVLQGKISNSSVPDMEREVSRRFQDSYLYKEIQRLKTEGKTLDEAIQFMEGLGYSP